MNSSWYFTAPWNPKPVRRGDALGFRAGADYFADLLAPGLSNSTIDARWITLLSWCLKWSHVTWCNAGGGDLSLRDVQQARYAWLRPLELLWVARTLETSQDKRQLRGRLSINRWFEAKKQPPKFSMSPDQFRRYRQVGMYGAYRVVFRNKDFGLTTDNGWTPSDTALKLAELVNSSLPCDAQLKEVLFENGTKWGYWNGQESRYWVERGWPKWDEAGRTKGLLPTPDTDIRSNLPKDERKLLKNALFSENSILHVTANVLANATGAKSHAELCDVLAGSDQMAKKLAPASLASLPAFTRFADAAMNVMRGLWAEINQDKKEQAPPIEKLANLFSLQLDELQKAGDTWLDGTGREHFPHQDVVSKLADAIRKSKTPLDQLRALAMHHNEHGGGRRWFCEESGKLKPLVAYKGNAASDYRFRLNSLCRLAAQCGVAKMDHSLDAIAQQEFDEEEEDI